MLIFLVSITNKISAQFIPMQKYQYKAIAADTLYDMTGCGEPEVHPLSYRRVVTYFDSCAGIPYWHNPSTSEWVTISDIPGSDTAYLYPGFGLILADGEYYAPNGDNKTMIVDSAALKAYFDNFYGATTIFNDSSQTIFTVDDIVNSPPGGAVNGNKYLVGTSPTGDFSDYANHIAELVGGVYSYTAPVEGDWVVVDNADNATSYRFNGTAWIQQTIYVGWFGDRRVGRNAWIGKYDKQPVFFRSWNKIFMQGDTTRHVYFPKWSGLENEPIFFKPGAGGKLDTGHFRLPVYDSPAMPDSIAYIENGQIKYGAAGGSTARFGYPTEDVTAFEARNFGLRDNYFVFTGGTSFPNDIFTLGQDNIILNAYNGGNNYGGARLTLTNQADDDIGFNLESWENGGGGEVNISGNPLTGDIKYNAATHTFDGNTIFEENGTPGAGKVATATDTDGNWTWQAPSGGGSFVQADTIIYLSRSAGVVSDADIYANTSSGATDNTTAIQNILDLAPAKSIKVIWDVSVSFEQLKIHGNTFIDVLPGRGAILENGSNKPMFINSDTAFYRDIIDSNITIQGGFWNGNYTQQSVVGTSSNGPVDAFCFFGVKNLTMRNFTIYNQKVYGVHGIRIINGLVENGIISSTTAVFYTDGVHFDGNSTNCIGRNLKIRGGDDAIANNADDVYLSVLAGGGALLGYYPAAAAGPINNIRWENIFLDSCRYGYRALSGASRIDNIVIKNLTGATQGYSVVIDNFQQFPDSITNKGAGSVGTITIESNQVSIYATASMSNTSLINVNCNVEQLILKDIKRNYFFQNSVPTVLFGSAAGVRSFVLDGYVAMDSSAYTTSHIVNSGSILNALISGVNIRRPTYSASKLVANSATIKNMAINNVVLDSLAYVYDNTGSVVTKVAAANIIYNTRTSIAAFSSTTAADTLILSNFKGGATIVNGAIAYYTGDAFSQWSGNGTNMWTANSTAKIGIGTSSPTYDVHVLKNAAFVSMLAQTSSSSGEAAMWAMSNAGYGALEVYGSSGATPSAVTLSSSSGMTGGFNIFTGGNAPLRFQTNGTSNNRMIILGSGEIGIGTTSPVSSLEVQGSLGLGYRNISSARTLDATDYLIDCTSGTFTVTLPAAAGAARRQYVITNRGSGTITIATTSSQQFVNINGTPTSLTLDPVGAGAITSYSVYSAGAAWIVTGKVKNE